MVGWPVGENVASGTVGAIVVGNWVGCGVGLGLGGAVGSTVGPAVGVSVGDSDGKLEAGDRDGKPRLVVLRLGPTTDWRVGHV